MSDPLSLLHAVFYYNGKNFCLRGGIEHRELKLSQLRREKDGYRYTEHASKNRAGGLAQVKLKNKSVFIAEVPEAGERCHCSLLNKYLSKLPKKAIEADIFYVRPLDRITPDSLTWYSSTPVGKNKLYKKRYVYTWGSRIQKQPQPKGNWRYRIVQCRSTRKDNKRKNRTSLSRISLECTREQARNNTMLSQEYFHQAVKPTSTLR